MLLTSKWLGLPRSLKDLHSYCLNTVPILLILPFAINHVGLKFTILLNWIGSDFFLLQAHASVLWMFTLAKLFIFAMFREFVMTGKIVTNWFRFLSKYIYYFRSVRWTFNFLIFRSITSEIKIREFCFRNTFFILPMTTVTYPALDARKLGSCSTYFTDRVLK